MPLHDAGEAAHEKQQHHEGENLMDAVEIPFDEAFVQQRLQHRGYGGLGQRENHHARHAGGELPGIGPYVAATGESTVCDWRCRLAWRNGIRLAQCVDRRLARRTGLETAVEPVIVCRLLAHPALDDGVDACRIGDGVAGWEILQLRLDADIVTRKVRAANHGEGHHGGAGHGCQPRGGRIGGRRDSEERREYRIGVAVVLVRRVPDDAAVPQAADHAT